MADRSCENIIKLVPEGGFTVYDTTHLLADGNGCLGSSNRWQGQSRGKDIGATAIHEEGFQHMAACHEASVAAKPFAEGANVDVHLISHIEHFCCSPTSAHSRGKSECKAVIQTQEQAQIRLCRAGAACSKAAQLLLACIC